MTSLRVALIGVVALVCLGAAPALHIVGQQGQPAAVTPGAAVFTWVDVFVDSGDRPLAAYQIEVHDTHKNAKIVGVEGGDHAAFKDPPYYDPAAMMNDRVIIAALSTAPATALPTGRVRVARLHVRLAGDGESEFAFTVQAASGPDAAAVPVEVSLIRGDRR